MVTSVSNVKSDMYTLEAEDSGIWSLSALGLQMISYLREIHIESISQTLQNFNLAVLINPQLLRVIFYVGKCTIFEDLVITVIVNRGDKIGYGSHFQRMCNYVRSDLKG